MELTMGSAWSMPRLGPERSTSERAHDLSLLSIIEHELPHMAHIGSIIAC